MRVSPPRRPPLATVSRRDEFVEFESGERGALHFHGEPTEEYYVVPEGTLDVELDGETFEAGPGTVVSTPAETAHYPEDNSDEPARLLSVSAPDVPRGDGVTVVDDGR